MSSRYGAAVVSLILTLAITPWIDEPTDAFRVVEIGTSLLIAIVLANGAVLYWRRAGRGEMLLTGPEYVVVIGCILGLLAAATLVVVQRLVDPDNPPYSVTLILSILVQPPLLWWAIRMEQRLERG